MFNTTNQGSHQLHPVRNEIINTSLSDDRLQVPVAEEKVCFEETLDIYHRFSSHFCGKKNINIKSTPEGSYHVQVTAEWHEVEFPEKKYVETLDAIITWSLRTKYQKLVTEEGVQELAMVGTKLMAGDFVLYEVGDNDEKLHLSRGRWTRIFLLRPNIFI